MQIVKKAVAVVTRPRGKTKEVLVFQHPTAGIQIPKGTVEKYETVETATLRELSEESGIVAENTPKIIGTWRRTVKGGHNEDGPLEINEWYIGILKGNDDLPDHWCHEASGSPAEEGLAFKFFWLPIDHSLSIKLDPLFSEVARMIMEHHCADNNAKYDPF